MVSVFALSFSTRSDLSKKKIFGFASLNKCDWFVPFFRAVRGPSSARDGATFHCFSLAVASACGESARRHTCACASFFPSFLSSAGNHSFMALVLCL